MYTYQDFIENSVSFGIGGAIDGLLSIYKETPSYKIAIDADSYSRQQNSTIMNFIKKLYTVEGIAQIDTESANNKLCSDFYRQLNVMRNMYSLGNGISFDKSGIKEKLGKKFDQRLKKAGYFALTHGVSYIFWNLDHIHVFKATEFAPLWDEETGELRAGVRWWQIDANKPVYAVLYEIDGYTKFRKSDRSKGGTGKFEIVQPKHAYKVTYSKADADLEPEIVGEENYSTLPIIPMYATDLRQSTLIGMKGKLDAHDLVNSGFANDLHDCAEIYWILSGAGGMDNKDLQKFMNRLKYNHIATLEDMDDVKATPYTQEIPYQSRKEFLTEIRNQIFEDFGVLDVHTVSAGATNDHIEAGYQPMDNVADDYEFEIIEAVEQLTKLVLGEAYTPLFKRNKISNMKEQTDMIIECSDYLDTETVLNHLPFLTPDEVKGIMDRKEAEEYERFDGRTDISDSDGIEQAKDDEMENDSSEKE